MVHNLKNRSKIGTKTFLKCCAPLAFAALVISPILSTAADDMPPRVWACEAVKEAGRSYKQSKWQDHNYYAPNSFTVSAPNKSRANYGLPVWLLSGSALCLGGDSSPFVPCLKLIREFTTDPFDEDSTIYLAGVYVAETEEDIMTPTELPLAVEVFMYECK